MKPRLSLVAAALPFVFTPQLHAQQAQQPIVVTATRQETRVAEILADVTVIDREEIERNGAGTVADLLIRQPGIQVTTSGNSGPGSSTSIFVRGANPDQTKVLVDGIPISGGLDQGGSKALLNLSLANIERIEILRGPASSLYGADAIGGVIQVFTRKGQQGMQADAFVGFGTYGTTQTNAGLSAGNEQWRLRLDGMHTRSDGFSAQKNATNQDADKDGYLNKGVSGALSFLPAPGHEVGLTYRQSAGRSYYDSGNVPANGTYDNRTEVQTEQWQLFSRNQINSLWTSQLQYGQTDDKQTNYSSYAPSGSAAETQNHLLSWQNDLQLPLGKMLLGAEQLKQQAYSQDAYLGYDTQKLTNNAVFAGWTGHMDAHRWQLNARQDNHSAFGHNTTGALGYGYQLDAQWRARASYGTAFKAPTINQLYMPTYGNPNLKPEEARNSELGLVWERGPQSVSATYYDNRIKNLISYDPNTWVNYNIGEAQLKGMTLAYAGQLGDWTMRANYDWLHATDETTGYQLQRRARNKALFAAIHRQGAFQTGVELVTEGSRFDDKQERYALGGYSLVNLTLRYNIDKALAVEGRINNLFDRDYELARASSSTTVGTYGVPGRNAFVGLRYSYL